MSSDAELLTTLQTMQKSLKRVLDSYKAVTKALDKFDKNDALKRQDYLDDALSTLKTADLSIIGYADQKTLICGELEERLHAIRQNAKRNLITGLSEHVDMANKAHFKILSDSPLVIYIHPLTLEVNFEAAKAKWTYAREELVTTSLDAKEIMSAHAEILESFRATRIDSAQFFTACKMAYEMTLIKRGLKQGERVDIVELLTPIAWLWPEPQCGKKGMTQLPRHIMAYQLQKLRAEKMISQNGIRVDLGAATGGTTRNKANVLYVPHSSTDGQYYLSICFREA